MIALPCTLPHPDLMYMYLESFKSCKKLYIKYNKGPHVKTYKRQSYSSCALHSLLLMSVLTKVQVRGFPTFRVIIWTKFQCKILQSSIT